MRFLLLAAILCANCFAQDLKIEIPGGDGLLVLKGADARRQILVSGKDGRDFSAEAAYEVSPEGVVKAHKGYLLPMADGEATIKARAGDLAAELKVKVENAKTESPINFANQIVPIFTKNGCNGGGCHGKSSGQNGFKLSLLGFEPGEDYEFLVREARARRLFPAAPERSLLLLKGAAMVAHGGGQRLTEGSDDYRLLVRWIGQGMPQGADTDPKLSRIEVFPKERVMARGGKQQLAVLAHYTDGSIKDVTRGALFEPNDKNLAKSDETGLVNVFDLPGDVAVMVRYQDKVAVFRAMLPLGAPVDKLPEPRNFIDTLVFAKLKKMGLPPSARADDATFVRRVTLDIAGRLPTADEAGKFVADPSPIKRDVLIDTLLDSTDYADHFANKWAALLRNKRSDPKLARSTFSFHGWLRDSFVENKPFDQLAREIVAASGEVSQNPAVAWFRQVGSPNAQLEDTAQLFLGTRLQCAQCHHHPYEKWSQDDYYKFAAVFSSTGKKPGAQAGEEIVFTRRGAARANHKKTGKAMEPGALGTHFADLQADDDPRQKLADWMAAPENPFFARSLANRYWKHFFSRGLVEPEDDIRETNPATNPELLDALAKRFVETKFDLKQLVREICRSETYQLSSIPNEHNAVDRSSYSRYYPKRLAAETLFDSVNSLIGAESKFDGVPVGTRAMQLPDNSFNASSYFLTVFGRPESSSACECERSQEASLAQALHLLNAKDLQEKLAADSCRPAALAKDTRPDEDKLRELYQQALARNPSDDEMKMALAHLNKKPDAKRAAFEDILWALLNTKEFLFNH